MPLVFTREEIRELLAINGYEEVSEEALDRFMSDLKKLIKHEDLKRRRKRLGHDSTPTAYSDSTADPSSIYTPTNGESVHYDYNSDDDDEDGDGPRYLKEIIAGSIKQPDFEMMADEGDDESDGDEYDDENVENLKDMQYNDMLDSKKVPSATKSTNTNKSSHHSHSTQHQHQQVFNEPPTRDTSSSSDSGTSREILNERNNNTVRIQNQNAPEPSGIKWNRVEAPGSVSGRSVISVQSARSLCSNSSSGKPPFYLTSSGSTCSDNPEDEFRRYKPNPKLDIPMYIRRDPVLLYQYYKGYWDQAKIPGEEKHLQLRWNARQVISNKPCLDGKIVDYLGPKAKVLPKRCSSAKH